MPLLGKRPISPAPATAPAPPATSSRSRKVLDWSRGLALVLVAAAGLTFFLRTVNEHYDISKWLFWIYARIWLWTLVCGAACLSSGVWVTTRLLRWRAPWREAWLISFAVGAFIFANGVFVAGLFHGLGPVFFVGWPLVLLVPGAWPAVATARRVWRLLPHVRRVARTPRAIGMLALAFGMGGVALVYSNILTPANAAFDSRWYHLAIAEHYASGGAVTRFPEGWFCGTYPHLASFFYTWAFLLPDGDLFARTVLAAHLEFLIFAATLAGIGMLARWSVADGNARVRHAWAAVFLFPGILLYDASLSLAADHVLAFWGPPIFLLTRRLLKRWDARSAGLLGLLMAGAILTKYQAVYLLAVPSILIIYRCAQETWRARRIAPGRALAPLLVLGGVALILTTPLWLKNWIWYGDPVYPMLGDIFSRRPWVDAADPDKFLRLSSWTPQGPLSKRLKETLLSTVSFSFYPHDWWNLHGAVPVFGSLFTLCMPFLFFIRPRRRLVFLVTSVMVGIAIWYWTYHQDRYLQALVPWMAAALAGILALTWQAGWSGRLAVTGLVAGQVVWGGDVYTFPTHAMLGTQPVRAALDLISSGYRKDWAARNATYMDLAPVAPLLPRGPKTKTKVLIHERFTHFGLGAMTVADLPGTQAGISYVALENPAGVYRLLRQFGVTHVLWTRGTADGHDYLADNLVFYEFAEKYTVNQTDVVGVVLGTMPATAPADVRAPRLVRIQRCEGPRTILLSQVDAAIAGAPIPEAVGTGPPAFYLVQSGCAAIPPESVGQYRLLLNRSGFDLFALKAP